MADNNKEHVSARLEQFKSVLTSFLGDGGKLISGQVTSKNNWPAKDGRNASWQITLSVFGESYKVTVSQRLHDAVRLGDYHLLAVTQRASGNVIYNTAVE